SIAMNGVSRLLCVRYEMTQREFRRLRREKWSRSFISKFGKLASKLYRELYKREPPYRRADEHDREPVNLYPYGMLEQAYRRLISAGEQRRGAYPAPDPAIGVGGTTKGVPLAKKTPSLFHTR